MSDKQLSTLMLITMCISALTTVWVANSLLITMALFKYIIT